MYILYSATKVITNVAMMRLVEQGRLGLEDELSRYLPEFSRMQVQTPDGLRPAELACMPRRPTIFALPRPWRTAGDPTKAISFYRRKAWTGCARMSSAARAGRILTP